MLDIFPEEIWCKIILEIPCSKIINICKNIYYFKELCDKNNLIKRRKIKGFPRETGSCKIYTYDLCDESSLIKDMNNKASKELYGCPIDLEKENIKILLNYIIYELNYNLIRGDLIHLVGIINIYLIFDGCNIIDLVKREDDFDIIPEEFTVINNNIPINYFNYIYNKHIWVNSLSIQDQLINNIYYNKEEDIIYTKFNFNNIIYKIEFKYDYPVYKTYCQYNDNIYNVHDRDKNNDRLITKNIFRDVILKNNLLLLEYNNSKLFLDFNDNKILIEL